MNVKSFLKEYGIISAATLITAVAVYFFLIPSHVTVGSISGFVLVLSNFLPFPISFMTLVLNAVLLLFGFIFIGREFGAKTIYTSVLLPLYLAAFEILFPNQVSITGDPFLDMLGYVLVASFGLAVLFNRNASSGGLDIIAKFLNKYFHIELGKAMSLAGMCAALSSVLVYEGKIVFLSLLGTYLNGIILDHFILGFHVKKRVCIISEKKEEILSFLMNTLHCGATLYQAVGAFDKRERTEIITIVNRNEYAHILGYLQKTDPDAFVTVYTVNEVITKKPGKRLN